MEKGAWKYFDSFFDLLVKNNAISDAEIRMALRSVYEVVKKEIGNLNSSKKSDIYDDICNEMRIEISSRNIKTIIDLFGEAKDSRDNFSKEFPRWKKCRIETIEKLDRIAETLNDERKIINCVKIISSTVGIAGAAAVLSSIFFPPAAVLTLPAFLGGFNVATILPSCVLGAVAAPATPVAAVAGGVATAVSGVSQMATSITEIIMLKKRLDEAKDLIAKDKEKFECLKKWFKHTKKFNKAMNSVLDISCLEIILKDFKEFFDKLRNLSANIRTLDSTLKQLFSKICKLDIFHQIYSPEIILATVGVLFTLYLISRGNRFLFTCILATNSIGCGLSVVGAGTKAATVIGAKSATGVVKSRKEIISNCLRSGRKGAVAGTPKVLIHNIALGAFTGLGMALDAANIVMTTIDLSKGSANEEATKIKTYVENLIEELEVFEEVYIEFENFIINEFFRSTQKLTVHSEPVVTPIKVLAKFSREDHARQPAVPIDLMRHNKKDQVRKIRTNIQPRVPEVLYKPCEQGGIREEQPNVESLVSAIVMFTQFFSG